MNVSFLGLGVMGFPMAGHLANAGHAVSVYNRRESKRSSWAQKYQGDCFAEIAPCVAASDAVFACVGNDDDSLAVAEIALNNMPEGSVYVDHTTTSAACAEKIAAKASNRKIGFVDAPVSGGEAGAVNGQLAIMCGGDEPTLDKVRPLMDIYAKRIVHIGGTGQGQLCKAVNQIAIAGLLQALSEAVHFAQKSGLDIDKTLEAVSGGAAQSWQMENRARTMFDGAFDFGFAVDWMRKDLEIALTEAQRFGADLPITQIIDGYYEEVQAAGGNRWDTSSLITRLS